MTLPFDTARLQGWLERHAILDGAPQIRPIGDGHSNLTYALTTGERTVVLRRPPPPPTPPGANDVLREARILRALVGTAVPVPGVLGVAAADEAMNVPFFVMEHVDGEACTAILPPALQQPDERRRTGEALIDALLALHDVDWRARGLGDLGRPDGFLERQLTRLPRLIPQAPAPFGELAERLTAELPSSGEGTLVHGDLRLGNVMVSRERPARLLAVLDWELAGIGDPLTDLGYTLATYAVVGEAAHALTDLSAATLGEGFPSRAALAARYASASGRDVSALPWYEAFALWKLAVLFQYGRSRGEDPYYADPAHVEGLLAAARRVLGTMERSCR